MIEANANSVDEIDQALMSLSQAGANVIVVLQTNLLLLNASHVADGPFRGGLPPYLGIVNMSLPVVSSVTALIFVGATAVALT